MRIGGFPTVRLDIWGPPIYGYYQMFKKDSRFFKGHYACSMIVWGRAGV